MQRTLLKMSAGWLLLGLAVVLADAPDAPIAGQSALAMAPQLPAAVSALNTEEGTVPGLEGHARNDLHRRVKQFSFRTAIFISLITSLALAFVAVRCYKALRSNKNASWDGRRLAVGGDDDQGHPCEDEEKEEPDAKREALKDLLKKLETEIEELTGHEIEELTGTEIRLKRLQQQRARIKGRLEEQQEEQMKEAAKLMKEVAKEVEEAAAKEVKETAKEVKEAIKLMKEALKLMEEESHEEESHE